MVFSISINLDMGELKGKISVSSERTVVSSLYRVCQLGRRGKHPKFYALVGCSIDESGIKYGGINDTEGGAWRTPRGVG